MKINGKFFVRVLPDPEGDSVSLILNPLLFILRCRLSFLDPIGIFGIKFPQPPHLDRCRFGAWTGTGGCKIVLPAFGRGATFP